MSDEAIERARAGFADAQKRCGTGDVVARVRVMPDASVDVAWMRREAMRSRLRLGSLAGTQPQLARIASQLARAAPKGSFYAIVVTAADDSDAMLAIVSKEGTHVAMEAHQGVTR